MIDIVKAAIKALLVADATFTGYIPSTRIFADSVEISRTDPATAVAFDANEEILPTCLIKSENFNQFGPLLDHNAGRGFVTLLFYQRHGFSSLYPAQSRARALLHANCVTKVWEITWAEDVYDLEDDPLECAFTYSRYIVVAKMIG